MKSFQLGYRIANHFRLSTIDVHKKAARAFARLKDIKGILDMRQSLRNLVDAKDVDSVLLSACDVSKTYVYLYAHFLLYTYIYIYIYIYARV